MIMEEALGNRIVEGMREAAELAVRAPRTPLPSPGS